MARAKVKHTCGRAAQSRKLTTGCPACAAVRRVQQRPIEAKASPSAASSTKEQPVQKRDYMIAKTDLTIFGQTFGRGQYFNARLFKRLPEKRRAQLIELKYVRNPEPDDAQEHCDKCGGEFCSWSLYNRHQEEVHLRGSVILDGPTPKSPEDVRPPVQRESRELSDAEFEARVAV